MNPFKCYHSFIPGRFLWLKLFGLYIILPAICLGLSIAAGLEPSGALVMSVASVMAGVDMFSDLWIMNGTERVDARQFPFLRGSFKGWKFFHAALRGDFYRRFLTYFGTTIVGFFLCRERAITASKYFFFVGIGYIVLELFIAISRMFDNMVFNTVVLCVLFGVVSGMLTVASYTINEGGTSSKMNIIWPIVTYVIGLGIATLRFKLSREAFERSYQ